MNKVMLIGRLVRDPDIRYTQGEKSQAVARYALAVTRKTKNTQGRYDADFINCIAFGKQGEFAEKWLHQGTKIAVTGRIQTGNYTNKDGQKVYTTDVVIEEVEFAESKNASADAQDEPRTGGSTYTQESVSSSVGEGFMGVPDGVDDTGLPFN